jgi:hypothetical protein
MNTVMSLLIFIGGTVGSMTIGAETCFAIPQEQAIKIANRAVAELDPWYSDLSRFDIKIDDDQKHWKDYQSEVLSSQPREGAKQKFAELNARLNGKIVWLVNYSPKQKPGSTIMDGGADVWVDATTGQVLAIIYGDGRLR